MISRLMQIAMLLPVLAGCESYVQPLGTTNSTIADARQGRDCRRQFLIGGVPDLTGAQAMRSGGMTTLRRAEYRVDTFSGVGTECVTAYGE